MPKNVAALSSAVIGRRIVSAETKNTEFGRNVLDQETVLTLDDGTCVSLHATDDCCAFTSIGKFLLSPDSVDHMILGVGTTEEYTVWHIYADFGDVMTLEVNWSCGNPFYYGYGFDIRVSNPT